jgi:hypothetical protein
MDKYTKPKQTLHDCELTYACDHEKNTQCHKTSCKHNPNTKYSDCESTISRDFAKTEKDGEPIIHSIKYQGALYLSCCRAYNTFIKNCTETKKWGE